MSTPPLSPLDRPASIPVLRRLLGANAITPLEAEIMESQVRRDLPWKTWLDRGLLALGVVLILAGIGYFFAHNWDHLTNNDKLGLAGGAVLLSLLGATWAGLNQFPGKILLLAASALVGVYLAVFWTPRRVLTMPHSAWPETDLSFRPRPFPTGFAPLRAHTLCIAPRNTLGLILNQL